MVILDQHSFQLIYNQSLIVRNNLGSQMRATKIGVNFSCEIKLGLPSKITRSSSSVVGNMLSCQSRGRKVNIRFSGLSSPVYIWSCWDILMQPYQNAWPYFSQQFVFLSLDQETRHKMAICYKPVY